MLKISNTKKTKPVGYLPIAYKHFYYSRLCANMKYADFVAKIAESIDEAHAG